jgi:hypothetical protein
MANRKNTFLIKRSSTPGKVPTAGDLLLGELALNTADVILYASGTTANSILPIGWDRVARTGDTMTGTLYAPSISATTISATTYYGLPIDVYVTGGTFNAGTATFTNNTGGTFSITGFSSGSITADTYTTGFTYSNNVATIKQNQGQPDLSILINTMTGLTVSGDVTFSGGSILNPDYLQFNVDYTGNTTVEGRMYWDEQNGSVSLGMHGSQVLQQIGLEYYYYIKNQSGATIENGRVVRAAGTVGASGRILGEYMIADGSVPSKFCLGVATEDILNGDDGYVTEFGLVRGIDTTGSLYGETWSDGDILWVSPTIPGGLTNIEPQTPDLHIEMAIVVYTNASGSIFVRPNRYAYSHDLQDFGWSGGTENNLDIIQWNSSLGYFELTNTPKFLSVSANTISATTYYGDGSNLTGIVASWDGLQVITAGENVNAGDLLFLSADSKYYKASNTNEAYSSTELRIAVSAITANSTGSGLIQGEFTTTGLTAGDKYWVGTSGNYTNIQPNGNGDIVRLVGTALSSTKLEFNPDQTYIELSSSSGTGTQPALRSITTSQTALVTDLTLVCLSALTVTIPTAVGINGKIYNIKSRTTGTITINSTGGETFDDAASLTITVKNTNITIQSDGTNWIII